MATSWHSTFDQQSLPTLLLPRNRNEVRSFLSKSPARNIYQLSWIEHWGMDSQQGDGVFHFRGLRNSAGQLCAVALVVSNRLLLLESTDLDYSRRLGEWYRKKGFHFNHLVSPADVIEPFWNQYGEPHEKLSIRLDKSQSLFSLRPNQSNVSEIINRHSKSRIRPARPDDLEKLVEASAQMQLEETKRDPLRHNADNFEERIRQRIEHQRSYIWLQNNELIFKADISAKSQLGLQISGVYTSPEHRGQGIATRGLAQLCRRLFKQHGTDLVTLYADRKNKAAITVYEKIGFTYEDAYRTIHTN